MLLINLRQTDSLGRDDLFQEYKCGELAYNMGRLALEYKANCLGPTFHLGEMSWGKLSFGPTCPDSICFTTPSLSVRIPGS